MDLRLFERVTDRRLGSGGGKSLDLACGTGRIGAWLKTRTSAPIDGVDLTPEMLDVARRKRIYRALTVADVTDTRLAAATYDLCTQSWRTSTCPICARSTPKPPALPSTAASS